MKTSEVLLLILLFFSLRSYGQQEGMVTFAYLNKAIYNPGSYGTAGSLRAAGIIRKQWVALAGSPGTQLLALDMPLGIVSGAAGLVFRQYNSGVHKLQKLTGGYAYRLALGDENAIGLGVAAGYWRLDYDGNAIRTPEGEYGTGQLEHHDALLVNDGLAGAAFTLDAGISGNLHAFEWSVAVTDIPLSGKASTSGILYKRDPHFFADLAIAMEINSSIDLGVDAQLAYNSGIAQSRVFVTGTWEDLYTIGVNLRGYGKTSLESVGFLAGWQLNERFRFFYSYEHNILPLRKVFDANHELMLAYTLNRPLGRGRMPKPVYNPRFF